MTLQNTSPDGPVPETVVAEPVVAESTSVEETFDDQMDAIWDAANAPESDAEDPKTEVAKDDETPDETTDPKADETTDSQPTATESEVKTPDGLPSSLREQWESIPAPAREAIVNDRADLHGRLSDMGRQVQGIAPIRDAITQAMEQLPQLADMRPQEVAAEVFEIAKISHSFKANPVGTMLGLVKQHGLEQAVAQALSGQGVTQDAQNVAAMQQHIQKLEAQIQRVTDPNYLQEQVTNITSQDRMFHDVNTFAATAEHWADMEPQIPAFIPIAQQKLGDGAAPSAVLEAAYNMAIEVFKPDAKAPKAETVKETVTAPDPLQVARAIKAKSVNVTGKSTGKARDLTEDEMLDQAWERAQKA